MDVSLFVDSSGADVKARPGAGTSELIESLTGTGNLTCVLWSNHKGRPVELDRCDPTTTVIFTLFTKHLDLGDSGDVSPDDLHELVTEWSAWIEDVYKQAAPKGFHLMNIHPMAIHTSDDLDGVVTDFSQGVALYEKHYSQASESLN